MAKLSQALRLSGTIALLATLSACAPQLQQLNKDLSALNQSLAGVSAPNTTAIMPVAAQSGSEQATQLILPSDSKTREAIDAALPTVKKVLATHQCIKTGSGMLQLNFLSTPGVSHDDGAWNYPNSNWYVKYHDRNKCMNVRAIDQWTMPALNALQFRAVYFAEDSGETVNFSYLMKRMDDGSWKLQKLNRVG
jgi:hypothetical protein